MYKCGKNRITGLPESEGTFTIGLRLVVSTQHRCVTDGRPDRRTDGQIWYYRKDALCMLRYTKRVKKSMCRISEGPNRLYNTAQSHRLEIYGSDTAQNTTKRQKQQEHSDSTNSTKAVAPSRE